MSKHKAPMTAEELMKRLENDPEYQARRTKQDQRLQQREAEHARLEEPILDELKSNSFNGESIAAIVKNHAPLPESAVAVLLRWLSAINHEELKDRLGNVRLAESVVRALAATRIPFDGRALTDCFEKTSDDGLKWAVANTVALTNPHSIDEWLSEKRKDQYWGKILRELGDIH